MSEFGVQAELEIADPEKRALFKKLFDRLNTKFLSEQDLEDLAANMQSESVDARGFLKDYEDKPEFSAIEEIGDTVAFTMSATSPCSMVEHFGTVLAGVGCTRALLSGYDTSCGVTYFMVFEGCGSLKEVYSTGQDPDIDAELDRNNDDRGGNAFDILKSHFEAGRFRKVHKERPVGKINSSNHLDDRGKSDYEEFIEEVKKLNWKAALFFYFVIIVTVIILAAFLW